MLKVLCSALKIDIGYLEKIALKETAKDVLVLHSTVKEL